jgi:hypothetical protein
MKLFLVGINHFDPLCRVKLSKWLQDVSKINSTPPSFIAVEWDENHFNLIKAQRKRFGELLKLESPDLSNDELEIFKNSLAYEGDTHIEIYPSVPIVWLDEGRVVNKEKIECYAEGRLNIYKGHSRGQIKGSLQQISDSLKQSQQAEIDLERSKIFAERIIAQITESNIDWAISITGQEHTNEEIPGSMRSLIKKAGFNFEVIKLY